jgi:hypothetical protein
LRRTRERFNVMQVSCRPPIVPHAACHCHTTTIRPTQRS